MSFKQKNYDIEYIILCTNTVLLLSPICLFFNETKGMNEHIIIIIYQEEKRNNQFLHFPNLYAKENCTVCNHCVKFKLVDTLLLQS